MNFYNTQTKKKHLIKYDNAPTFSSPTPNARAYFLAAVFQSRSSKIDYERAKARLLIAQYANLKKNWNENDADPIPREILLRSFEIVDILPFIPDIFPTACGTIQLEYEKENGAYLELELEEDRIKVFKIDQDNNESIDYKSYDDYMTIRRMVASFNEQ